MDSLFSFGETLGELLCEQSISPARFADMTGIDLSEIYRYLRKEYLPKFSNIIKIADCLHCSLDYLLGLTPYQDTEVRQTTQKFAERFRALLAKKEVSRYKMHSETKFSASSIDDWFHGRHIPSTENAIALAKYFDCTLDYLIGRE